MAGSRQPSSEMPLKTLHAVSRTPKLNIVNCHDKQLNGIGGQNSVSDAMHGVIGGEKSMSKSGEKL